MKRLFSKDFFPIWKNILYSQVNNTFFEGLMGLHYLTYKPHNWPTRRRLVGNLLFPLILGYAKHLTFLITVLKKVDSTYQWKTITEVPKLTKWHTTFSKYHNDTSTTDKTLSEKISIKKARLGIGSRTLLFFLKNYLTQQLNGYCQTTIQNIYTRWHIHYIGKQIKRNSS